MRSRFLGIPIDQLEQEALRTCEQLMLPVDQDLRLMQAEILEEWVRRRRALQRDSQLDDREVLDLAGRLRQNAARRAVGGRGRDAGAISAEA